MKNTIRADILAQCKVQKITVTALRLRVLDIVLTMRGVIKAYVVLSHLQEQSVTTVAPPTAYRALDFWAQMGVLHKIPAINGYILCKHLHECCHAVGDMEHTAFVLLCEHCGDINEQALSSEWGNLTQRLARNGFKLTEDYIVLTGVCAACQKKS